MGKLLLQKIAWPEVRNGQLNMYGAQVQFGDGETVFYNPRMASGKPLRAFESRLNYQESRRAPELPVLIPKKEYALELDIETVPPLRYFIEIQFFNRQEEMIENKILRENEEMFTCPEGTFKYTLHIRSAGCHTFKYRSLSIFKIVDEDTPDSLPFASKYRQLELPKELELVRNLIEID